MRKRTDKKVAVKTKAEPTVAMKPAAYDEHNQPVGADHPYAVRLHDLLVATKTIGPTSESRLRWLVDFARKPLTGHSGTSAEAGDCLVALVRPIPPNLVGGIPLPDPLSQEEVAALHAELDTTLRALVNNPAGRITPFPSEGVTTGLVRATIAGRTPVLWASTASHATVRVAILQKLRDLVLQVGGRLLACPICHAAFLKHRKQAFCDPVCAQKARNARKPRTKKEVTG